MEVVRNFVAPYAGREFVDGPYFPVAVFGVSILLVYLVLKQIRKGGVCRYSPDMEGKVVVITGSNSGIGLEAAKVFVELNATVVMANRDSQKSLESFELVRGYIGNPKVHNLILDLSNLDTVYDFVKQFKELNLKIDILVNNAGVAFPPYSKTAQGLNSQLGINHVGHFLLTQELLPLIDKKRRPNC
jgi:NAD(P)-dependent dehydrogenase (short-subunit alcohol dehydrogenase family)